MRASSAWSKASRCRSSAWAKTVTIPAGSCRAGIPRRSSRSADVSPRASSISPSPEPSTAPTPRWRSRSRTSSPAVSSPNRWRAGAVSVAGRTSSSNAPACACSPTTRIIRRRSPRCCSGCARRTPAACSSSSSRTVTPARASMRASSATRSPWPTRRSCSRSIPPAKPPSKAAVPMRSSPVPRTASSRTVARCRPCSTRSPRGPTRWWPSWARATSSATPRPTRRCCAAVARASFPRISRISSPAVFPRTASFAPTNRSPVAPRWDSAVRPAGMPNPRRSTTLSRSCARRRSSTSVGSSSAAVPISSCPTKVTTDSSCISTPPAGAP